LAGRLISASSVSSALKRSQQSGAWQRGLAAGVLDCEAHGSRRATRRNAAIAALGHMNRDPNHRDKTHEQYRQRPFTLVIKKNQNSWYVAIYLPLREKTGHYSRRSRTFASESEAKRFAAVRIAAGAEVSAGTINPFAPKRVVGPSEIERWLSEGPG
jgi:hypothetical protein